jgi:hypothetical protein
MAIAVPRSSNGFISVIHAIYRMACCNEKAGNDPGGSNREMTMRRFTDGRKRKPLRRGNEPAERIRRRDDNVVIT